MNPSYYGTMATFWLVKPSGHSCGSAIVTAIIFAFIESDSLIGWLLETSGDDIACSPWPAFPPTSHVRLFGRIFLQACLQTLFPEISFFISTTGIGAFWPSTFWGHVYLCW